MAYDKNSFLAGLAVGRSLKGWEWVASGIAPEPRGTFAVMVMATEQEHTISHSIGGFGITIDWGDGTSPTYLGSGGDVSHTYSDEAPHIVNYYGDITIIYFVQQLLLRKVLKPLPATMGDQSSLGNTFLDEQNLVSIPKDLLRNIPNLSVAHNMFLNCGIKSIPTGLFDYTPNLTSLFNCFSGTSITAIPENLFERTPNLTNLSYCFAGTDIESIPEKLFDYTPNMTDFSRCFRNCRRLTGNVPPLWEMFPNANGRGCFAFCPNISNIDDIPASWK